MALRSLITGRVLSFSACAVAMAEGEFLPLMRTGQGYVIDRHGALCPRHESRDCIEVYFAREYLASWSLRDFWGMRRRWKRQRSVANGDQTIRIPRAETGPDAR